MPCDSLKNKRMVLVFKSNAKADITFLTIFFHRFSLYGYKNIKNHGNNLTNKTISFNVGKKFKKFITKITKQ